MIDAMMEDFRHHFTRLANEFLVIGKNRVYRNRLGIVDRQDSDRCIELASPVFDDAGRFLRELMSAGGLTELAFWSKQVSRHQHDGEEPPSGAHPDVFSEVDYWIRFTSMALREKVFSKTWTEPHGHEVAKWSTESWPNQVDALFRGDECEVSFLSPSGRPDWVFLCSLSSHIASVLAKLCTPKWTGFVPSECDRLVADVLLAATSTLTIEQVDTELTRMGSHRSDKTIKNAINRLIDAGLVHRPNGERGGVAATPEGRNYLQASTGTE